MDDVDLNLLFWNLGLKNNPELIRDSIEYTDADIALFAEWGQLDTVALSAILPDDYCILPTMFDDAKILAVIKSSIELITFQEQTRYVVYSLSHYGKQYVVAGIHLQDKHSHPYDVARRVTAQELLKDVRQERANLSGAEAIIIGDFNVEPYDEILRTPNLFNAVYFKEVISRKKYRTWQRRRYEYLYSPMLCNYSEDGPQYGSFYCINLDLETYWHCLDQVLVTSGLADAIKSVSHLRSISDIGLISKVAPDKQISDHLPLSVRLSIKIKDGSHAH